MDSSPLVSVGVPTYNRPKQLDATLRYLITQDYNNIEIIVSDNHSDKPDVVEILNKYFFNEQKFKLIDLQAECGFVDFKLSACTSVH